MVAEMVMSPEDIELLRTVVENVMVADYALRILQVLSFVTCFLHWAAASAAICLLIMDRTNWRTNMQASLLVPYAFVCLPQMVFNFLSGEFGRSVALVSVVLELFIPRHFQDWFEMPGCLILLLVVAPNIFAQTLRNDQAGYVGCVMIGVYLLQEHLRATRGFRKSLNQTHTFLNTLGIILLLVYPIWCLLPFLRYL